MPAVFVLPIAPSVRNGPVASYLSTAGWAAAGARVVGSSWIVTPSGIVDPPEARRRAVPPERRSPAESPLGHQRATADRTRRFVPATAKTLAKDVLAQRRARGFHIDPDGPWRGQLLDFVWQRHELFHTAGLELAESLGVPSVLFVPATKVWEAERWGTRRPGWGTLVERIGEEPSLRRADLVACGSQDVVEQAIRLGTPPERILLTPTGVDLDLFDIEHDGRDEQRQALGLEGRLVIGWVGSFQPFHAVEQAIEAVTTVSDASLLLVGDGPERARLEALATRRGVHAVFTGSVPHGELPRYLAAMDVGLVLSKAGAGFHYSPLKLAEYLASGLPVVAPRVQPVTRRLTDGVDALLVTQGHADELRQALARLQADPELRTELGHQARQTAGDHWSWDVQVQRVIAALGSGPSA